MRCSMPVQQRTVFICLFYALTVLYTLGLYGIHLQLWQQTAKVIAYDQQNRSSSVVRETTTPATATTRKRTSAVVNIEELVQKFRARYRKSREKIPGQVQKLSHAEYMSKVQAICRKDSPVIGNRTGMARISCECWPPELRGTLLVNATQLQNYSWNDIETMFPNLDPGGHWKPTDCLARSHIAIIIPYRDRERHLKAFLAHTHPVLQRQRVEYQIFVIEQRSPEIFNKGSLMNAGFRVVFNKTDFVPNCMVFHDVDMLMLNDRNLFACLDYPRHMGAFVDKFNFSLLYNKMFGGAVSIKPVQFIAANGFSNKFEGWGGEDDDFYFRVIRRMHKIYRGPQTGSRYVMIKHQRDAGNPVNAASRGVAKKVIEVYKARTKFFHHGLNTVKFKIASIEYLPLYTHVVVDLLSNKTEE